MSHRVAIRDALVSLFKTELNGVNYDTNIYNNVSVKNTPFQDMIDFPCISVAPGPERREYQPSGVTWGYISYYIRVFTKDEEDPQGPLELVLSDIEACLQDNDPIGYSVKGVPAVVTDYNITNITTDEGLLAPYGVGEMVLLIRYQKT